MSVSQALLLFSAIATPWALGYLLLGYLYPATVAGARSLRLGYGFFLGQAITAGLLGLGAGVLGFFPARSLLALLLVTVALLLVAGRRRAATMGSSALSPRHDDAAKARALGIGLGALLLLGLLSHLALPLLEVLHRPVFPWDAWLNWMYRARLWTLSNALLPLGEAHLWTAGTEGAVYTVDGAHYPRLVSLIATWIGVILGEWSDTLVNLPAACAGAALAMALYGQCRKAGQTPLLALGAAYALLSLPLLGAHLALAGQADLWLCAYAGLGVIAVFTGLRQGQRRDIALGLLFCAVGACVKLEGTLWLLLALALLASARAGKHAAILALAILASLSAAAWLLPASLLAALVSQLETTWPQLAAVAAQGVVEQQLADDYWQNYFLGGSWHLAGWLAALLFAMLVWVVFTRRPWVAKHQPGRRGGTDPGPRLALVFLALQASVLLLVFNFSRHGAWAEDWTAINRLPLQLVAVHVFLFFELLLHPQPAPGASAGPQRWTTYRPLAAAGLLAACLGAVVGGAALVGAEGTATSRIFPASSLRAVVGGGLARGDNFWLESYPQGIAIASSGPVDLAVDDLPLVELRTGGGNRRGASFYWRSAADRENLRQRELYTPGPDILDLSDAVQDGERIVEFGVLSYRDPKDRPFTVSAVRFHAPTPLARLRLFWNHWTRTSPWSMKSVHWLPAGRADAALSLPLACALALGLLAVATTLRYRRRPRQIRALLVPALVLAWALLDARWIANLSWQAQRTLQDYPLLTATTHAFSDDRDIREAVIAAGRIAAGERAAISASDSRSSLILVGERADLRYQLLRAKYHALPRPAQVPEPPRAAAFGAGDQLLLLRSAYATDDPQRRDLAALARLLAPAGLGLADPVTTPRGIAARIIATAAP